MDLSFIDFSPLVKNFLFQEYRISFLLSIIVLVTAETPPKIRFVYRPPDGIRQLAEYSRS
jgi:hypothetical protein